MSRMAFFYDANQRDADHAHQVERRAGEQQAEHDADGESGDSRIDKGSRKDRAARTKCISITATPARSRSRPLPLILRFPPATHVARPERDLLERGRDVADDFRQGTTRVGLHGDEPLPIEMIDSRRTDRGRDAVRQLKTIACWPSDREIISGSDSRSGPPSSTRRDPDGDIRVSPDGSPSRRRRSRRA